MTEANPIHRRQLLQGGTGLLVSALAVTIPARALSALPPAKGTVTGKGPGDFDFLTGEWTIKHRRFDTSGPKGKEERNGSATVRRVLDGMGSIEELRDGDGKIFGMGVRIWHPQEKLWADHWTAAVDGLVNPPQLGQFIDGEGVFLADDEWDGQKVRIKAIWDKITPTSCRWYQMMSRDDGKSWESGWYMDWTRVG